MEWLIYLLKVSVCITFFFAGYLLMLRKLTFFRVNRFYLLVSLALSFVIPTLQFTVEKPALPEAFVEAPVEDLGEIGIVSKPIKTTPEITVLSPIVQTEFDWLGLLPMAYTIVMLVMLVLAIWRILQLLKYIKLGTKTNNGLKLVPKSVGFTNCSFFNYVFIDENHLTTNELYVLLKHEQVHAKQLHSLDKVILTIVKSVLWFNPIIYIYEKALEEMHEFEADQATSNNCGAAYYASLLLKLAIAKNTMPLIHNFVKNPVKDRIKMLFNSKSNHMKKLSYLLVLPLSLVLTWLFAIQVVTAATKSTKDTSGQDPIIGKEIKGSVVSFEVKDKYEVFNFKSGDRIYPITLRKLNGKINVGDQLTIKIGGNIVPPSPIEVDANGNKIALIKKEAIWMPISIYSSNGKKVYEYVLEKHAFLYESNRARYAWSIIKAIEKNANGTINRIILNDDGFTINLNVADQKFKSNDFKKGDSIVVKFIGEKLVAKNTYTTDKMIALYSWPKKYKLINNELYPKFYDENGKQKTYYKPNQPKIGQVKTYPKPILSSFSDANGQKTTNETISFNTRTNNITYVETADQNPFSKMEFGAVDSSIVSKANKVITLYGKARVIIDKEHSITGNVIEIDRQARIITAHDAQFETIGNKEKMVTNAKLITYNIDTKILKAKYGINGYRKP